MIPPLAALEAAEEALRRETALYYKPKNWHERRKLRHLTQVANFLRDTVALSRMGFLKRKVKR